MKAKTYNSSAVPIEISVREVGANLDLQWQCIRKYERPKSPKSLTSIIYEISPQKKYFSFVTVPEVRQAQGAKTWHELLYGPNFYSLVYMDPVTCIYHSVTRPFVTGTAHVVASR
ncbi:hypothetical protein FH972_026640 [Carpinus fangiana]|uniref:Uncharacterized protein n=1 Tax=Carpinus fangiana TaxID=176857 RepID=A0A5N6L734_9ROSI|nr:hypothetical protein FH972_026640 [Carpinus fangiana]